jgi:histidinol-phosphatase (PHP family)
MNKNYHTHHELCRHARGTAKDYVKAAIKAGMEVLGFSDHAPSLVIINDDRMRFDELETYLNDVEDAKKVYGDSLKILVGLEIEYLDTNPAYYQKLKRKVDYFILGQHYIHPEEDKSALRATVRLKRGKDIIEYAKSVESAIKTGMFALVAHPDIYLASYARFDEAARKAAHIIIDASIKHDVPLEFNANGIRRGCVISDEGSHYQYPRKEFWAIAVRKGATAVLSADAHDPSQLNDEAIENAQTLIKAWGVSTKDTLRI